MIPPENSGFQTPKPKISEEGTMNKYLLSIPILITLLCITTTISYREYLRGVERPKQSIPIYTDMQKRYTEDIIHIEREPIELDNDTLVKSDKSEDTVSTTYKSQNKTVTADVEKSETNEKNEVRVSEDRLSYSIKQKEKTDYGKEVAEYAEKLCTHEPQYNYELGGRELSTEDEEGIDCAHFVGLVFRAKGYDVKEDSNDGNVRIIRESLSEYTVAERTDDKPIKLSEMEPGDIIIFFNQGHDSHTGIYIGDGKIAHAASEDMGVTITDMEYDEETGTAGYNGKQIECVIRRAVEEEKTEDTSKNVIQTNLNIDLENKYDDAELSVVVNGVETKLYIPSRALGVDDTDISQMINVGDKKVVIDVTKQDNKVILTTTSDKDTEITVEPKIRAVKKSIGVNLSPWTQESQ